METLHASTVKRMLTINAHDVLFPAKDIVVSIVPAISVKHIIHNIKFKYS